MKHWLLDNIPATVIAGALGVIVFLGLSGKINVTPEELPEGIERVVIEGHTYLRDTERGTLVHAESCNHWKHITTDN